MGNSWGGFAALGAIQAGHPALRAGIVSCASDDGRTDDAHFESDVILSENLIWGTHLTTLAAMPTDPDLAQARGEDWRAVWKARLEAVKVFPAWWIQQRGNAAYAQVRNFRNLSDKACPVLLTGGWLDAYARGQWRLGQRLSPASRVMLGGQAHAFPHQTRPELSTDFTTYATRWFGRLLRRDEAPGKVPDAFWIYTHIPAAEDPRAEGYWIEVGDRRRAGQLLLPAPQLVSTPQERSGLILSFGKWCPGGDGGNEYAGYPGDPAPERRSSWVYRFPALEAGLCLGTPELALKKPPGPGVYLLRLFLCREGVTPRRVGYAVVDGRGATSPATVTFSPFGFETRPGDHLELHILPQAFPLLWAPFPETPLPPELPGALTLQVPQGWSKIAIPQAPGLAQTAPAAQNTTRIEVDQGTTTIVINSPYAETRMPDQIISGDSLQQIYSYGPQGQMAARILCLYTLKWPHRNEEISIRTDLRAQARGSDLELQTTLRASFGGKLFFERKFQDPLPGALQNMRSKAPPSGTSSSEGRRESATSPPGKGGM